MKGLHVRLEAFSASYPYPFLRSGTQLTMPAPAFSSILGNLSACAGRAVLPGETLVGFEFYAHGKAVDLERTRRLRMDSKTGRLSSNPEQGVGYREFHVRPTLDLYLSDTSFERFFISPAASPCLGRSQDLAWITLVRVIDLAPTESGRIRRTLVPFPNFQIGGQVLPPIADYFINDRLGSTRRIGRLSRYQHVPTAEEGIAVKSAVKFSLYHPDDSELLDHAIFLHDLRP
jgi:CRISPR-associated protein Cas5t